MFARLTIVQAQIDKIDEVEKVFKEGIIPVAKEQKGARGLYLLTDRKTGKGIALSFWDSEEDAVANEQSGYYQEQVGKVAAFFTSAPVREGYEVAVQG